MICSNCGRDIPDGSIACPVCGEYLAAPEGSLKVTENLAAMAEDMSEDGAPAVREDDDRTAAGTQEPVPAKGHGRRNPVWVFLSALAVIAGLTVYWFLPSNRYARIMDKAYRYLMERDYVSASGQYYKALEIYPEDETAREGIAVMYEETVARYVNAVSAGKFEEALDLAREANLINRDPALDRDRNLYEVYSAWIRSRAELGLDQEADSILELASGEIGNAGYTDAIRKDVGNIRAYRAIAEKIRDASAAALECDRRKDYRGVFGIMSDNLDDLISYSTEYGQGYPLMVVSGGTDYLWTYSKENSCVQLTIKGFRNGEADAGCCDTYYISGISDIPEFEFFCCAKDRGVPQGEFYEIDFASDPVVSDANFVISGTVKDGLYDGTQTISLNGKTYTADFTAGKITVKDTVDPNGESSNVVAYTADGNSWLSYPDYLLESSFGIRYIHE